MSRVLVVDDAPALREIMTAYIEREGHEVLEAGTIHEARECLRRVLGGSFKRPKFTKEGLKYLPAALSGIAGGFWGLVMSFLYKTQDRLVKKGVERPNLGPEQLAFSSQKTGVVA